MSMNKSKPKLVALVDGDTLTQKEFNDAFKVLTQVVQKLDEGNRKAIQSHGETLRQNAERSKADGENYLKTTKGELLAQVRQALDDLNVSHTAKLQEVDARMSEIKPAIVDEESIAARAAARIPSPKDGRDGSPDTPDQIVEKINQSSLQIAQERIVGLADTVRNMLANTASSVGITTTNFFKNGSLIGRAKNINFAEGTNMTVSMVQTGDQMNVTLASSGGSGGITVYTETLTDSGDHQNFTSAHTITTVFVLATLNGQYISSGNYSKSGDTITLTSPDANIASTGLEIVYA